MKKYNQGFSLIETAIALSIIGLLMGFSLKGRELIESAKIKSVITQIENYKIAVQVFFEKYGTIPGDLKDASNAISKDCSNGNQNGKLETIEDAKRFWEQLTKCGLISDSLENGFPTTKMGGILTVSSCLKQEGLWLIWCMNSSDNNNFSPIVPENIAYRINKSMDNGDPDSGDVNVIKKTDKNTNCIMMFRMW